MRFSTYILFLFALALTACSGCSSNSSSNPIETPEQPQVTKLDVAKCIANTAEDKLEIVTWNIENFPKTTSTISELAAIIKKMNVDVIALQEVTSKSKLSKLDKLLPNYKSVIMISKNVHLAYLYKTSEITINKNPYGILKNKEYEFAGRTPYVLPIHSKSTNLDIIIVNNHLKAYDNKESRARRKAASELLKNWVDTEHPTENVIILGDMNDEITDNASENVFQSFLDDKDNYIFADRKIALAQNKSQWSYPSYPSHIDHILITNELFDNEVKTYTYTFGKCDQEYDNIVSDHYPVCIVLTK